MPFLKSIGLYASAAALLLGLFAGWSIRDWKADSDTLAAAERGRKTEIAMDKIVDAASEKFEQFRAVEAPAAVERRDTIREIYRNVQVPAECAVPPNLVRLLADARQRANAAAAGQLEAAVREPAADSVAPAGP